MTDTKGRLWFPVAKVPYHTYRRLLQRSVLPINRWRPLNRLLQPLKLLLVCTDDTGDGNPLEPKHPIVGLFRFRTVFGPCSDRVTLANDVTKKLSPPRWNLLTSAVGGSSWRHTRDQPSWRSSKHGAHTGSKTARTSSSPHERPLGSRAEMVAVQHNAARNCRTPKYSTGAAIAWTEAWLTQLTRNTTRSS
jgi:hypothetical protein